MRSPAFTVAVALACMTACSKGGGHDAAIRDANLLSAPPDKVDNPSTARFGPGLHYLGSDVDATSVTAGSTFTLTHYWRVERAPGSGWALFTHIIGDDGEWTNEDSSPMRAAHPVKRWAAGQIIADPQRITLDAGWGSARAEVRVGLYRTRDPDKGSRMGITAPKRLVDRERRLTVATLSVNRKETVYRIERARGRIEIDGRASEDAWKDAPWGPDFTDASGGRKTVGRARARLLWDDEFLYAFIDVEDTDVFSPFSGRDATLWKADVVELFIDADGNRRGYVELQVNPNNAVFDAFFPRTRAQKHHFEWDSSMKTAVAIRGTADKRDDTDDGWSAEVAIPHADVKGMASEMAVRVPPKAGDRWWLNVVRVDKAKAAKGIAASSWNPITIRDFHALGRMLTVVFVDRDADPRPDAPSGTPSGAPPDAPPAPPAPPTP